MKRVLTKIILIISVFLCVGLTGKEVFASNTGNGIRLQHHMTQSLKQPYSGPCCAYAYGIGLSIILQKNIDPMQFYYGGYAHFDLGHVGGYTAYNATTVYDALLGGNPVMLHYTYPNSEHWVLIIGINGGVSTNNIQYRDFIVIDPASGAEKSLTDAWQFSNATVSGMNVMTGGTPVDPIDPNMPNPIYEESHWQTLTDTTRRPIVKIRNPEAVSKVRFAVWTVWTADQNDVTWFDGIFNGNDLWYCDLNDADFIGRNFTCHVYVYGKNGWEKSYTLNSELSDPIYSHSFWGYETETTRRPVVDIKNPEMVDKVRFAVWSVWTDGQNDITWYDGLYNGETCWYYDFDIADFIGRDFKCHVYISMVGTDHLGLIY